MILLSISDWFNSIVESLSSLSPIELLAVGLGIGVILFILIYILIASIYRRKRNKMHFIFIDFDGGLYQGSTDELKMEVKKGDKVDLSTLKPIKDGYNFNGFNFYKKYVHSVIDKNGLAKEQLTVEEFDGEKKDLLEMPNFDVYMVAKYSKVEDLESFNLQSEKYYSDFITIDDIVAEIKHLNEDKENYPHKINVRTLEKYKGVYFLFKENTLVAMLKSYEGITKVYLRTDKDINEKLLNPFYQAEDINDCYFWYSFVVIYNTKMSRIIRSFKEAYDEVDCSISTTSIEFNLILGAYTPVADPVVDRALMLVRKFELDKTKDPVPQYVIDRTLPEDFNLELAKKQTNFEEETDKIVLEEKTILEEEKKEETPEVTEEVVEEVKEEPKEEVKPVEEAPKEEETSEEVEVKEEVVEEDEVVDPTTAPEYDIKEDEVLSETEKEEIKIKRSALRYSREKLCEVVSEDVPQYASIVKRKGNVPYSLKAYEKTYAMVYENRFGLVRIILRLDAETATKVKENHESLKVSRFPIGPFWYQFYFDDSFYKKSEVKWIFERSRIFTKSLIDDENRKRLEEEEKNKVVEEVVEPVNEVKKEVDEVQEEIPFVPTPLNISKEDLIELVKDSDNFETEVKLGKRSNAPTSLKIFGKAYALVYLVGQKGLRVILRLDDKDKDEIKEKHNSLTPSKFPFGFFWYQIYIDDTFTSEEELKDIFEKSRIFSKKLIDQEEANKEN